MAFMRVQKQSSHLHPVLRGSPLPLSTFSLSIIRSKSGESFQLLFVCYFRATSLAPTSLLNPAAARLGQISQPLGSREQRHRGKRSRVLHQR